MATTVDKWVGVGTAMTVFTLLCSRMPDRIHDEVRHFITKWTPLVAAYFNPYVHLTISEQSDEQFRRNELFDDISAYLTDKCAHGARRLKAELVFHKRHRQVVLDTYLPRALAKGHELIANMTRQRRLLTNHRQGNRSTWCHVPFEHPATFDKLAMDPVQKEEIIDDLEAFMDGKQYYSDVGKAWKRGYLLYGPPGTGKSTLISAMANMLKYDVYDLDLTSVKNNSELRKLFIETKGRSIIVIEDIDAIEVDLAGNRKVADKKAGSSSSCCDHLPLDPNKDDGSKVTLSGLLSFVDGLWSASGGERVLVFTTNRVDMLDQALTRRGRMDMHIEMSYCRFGAFKVLANNYLRVRDHELFDEIKRLLNDTDTSPADVAHNLMPKSNLTYNRCPPTGTLQGIHDRHQASTGWSIVLFAPPLIRPRVRIKRKRGADMPPSEVAYYLKEDTDACLAGLVETLRKKAKRESTTAPTIEVAVPAQNGNSK
ncbi:hypothetical protein ACQ4PT_055956 [Festuca glaucescens]